MVTWLTRQLPFTDPSANHHATLTFSLTNSTISWVTNAYNSRSIQRSAPSATRCSPTFSAVANEMRPSGFSSGSYVARGAKRQARSKPETVSMARSDRNSLMVLFRSKSQRELAIRGDLTRWVVENSSWFSFVSGPEASSITYTAQSLAQKKRNSKTN